MPPVYYSTLLWYFNGKIEISKFNATLMNTFMNAFINLYVSFSCKPC